MRYLLFGSEEIYYAQGGANDFIESGAVLERLIEKARLMEDRVETALSWWHIMDTENMKIVSGTKWQAHGANNIENGFETDY